MPASLPPVPGSNPATPGGEPAKATAGPRKGRNHGKAGAPARRRRARARPAVKAPNPIPQREGKNLSRPLPPGCPDHLVRGTHEYRRWEAFACIRLRAAGLTADQIEDRLQITPDELRDRFEYVRKEADVGDAMLVWAEFEAANSRHTLDAERVFQRAIEAGDLANQTAALRLLHQIASDRVKHGLLVGVFARVNQGAGTNTLADLVRRAAGIQVTVNLPGPDPEPPRTVLEAEVAS